MGEEWRKAVREEVDKLPNAIFIREVKYSTWTSCDGAFGFQVLSFLDAYSGYNQIKMHAPDEEKTTFITEDANFCYRVMPFGLKNAGATY